MKEFKNSIQSKLLLLSVGTVAVVIMLMISIITIVSNIQLREDYTINSQNLIKILSNGLKEHYKEINNDINMLASNPLIKKADNTITTYKNINNQSDMTPSKNGGIEENIYEIFDNYGQSHTDTQYIYLATESGGYINWPETYITPNYDPTTREWYKLAVEANGEIISTDPYMDENNNMIISNVRAVYDDSGELIGVVGIDAYKEALSEIISELKVGDTGFYSIVNKNGLILADGRNPENDLKYLDEVNRGNYKTNLEEENISIIELDGEKYISNFRNLEGTDWVISFSISLKQLNQSRNKINMILGITSIGILIIMTSLSVKTLKKITKPIKDSANYLTEIGNGNFNEDIKQGYLDRSDEIGIITNGIYDMRTSIMKLIYEIENELMLFKKIADENKYSYTLIYDENDDIIYENNKVFNDNDYKNVILMKQKLIGDQGEGKLNEIKCALLEKGFWNGRLELKISGRKIEGTIQKIFNNKNQQYTVVNLVDITEKIKSEETLLEYEKIKSHEQIKNEFFANMSHELKTPLNIFSSTVQLLDIKSNGDTEEFKEIYNKHKQSLSINCKRMLRLINNIVDITKIDVGFTKAKFINCDIVKLVEDVTLSVANYARQKEVKVIFDTEVEELVVKCDVYMIERVILNLLSNAIKFTHKNGNILVYMSVDLKGVHIKVKDEGVGVPEEFREAIFERFIQSDKSLNRLNEGSGIGLAIVKSLVELNGGNVNLVDSNENGTTFEIIMPNEVLDDGNNNSLDYEVNFNNVEIELSDIYDLY